MPTLHTLNQSPSDSALASCLRCLAPGDSLLLLEDGVYAACSPFASALKACHCNVYVLQADAEARGIVGRIDPAIEVADYRGFVELAVSCDSVQSWY